MNYIIYILYCIIYNTIENKIIKKYMQTNVLIKVKTWLMCTNQINKMFAGFNWIHHHTYDVSYFR